MSKATKTLKDSVLKLDKSYRDYKVSEEKTKILKTTYDEQLFDEVIPAWNKQLGKNEKQLEIDDKLYRLSQWEASYPNYKTVVDALMDAAGPKGKATIQKLLDDATFEKDQARYTPPKEKK